MIDEPFSFYALARDFMDSNPELDLYAVARAVAELVPAKHRVDALATASVPYLYRIEKERGRAALAVAASVPSGFALTTASSSTPTVDGSTTFRQRWKSSLLDAYDQWIDSPVRVPGGDRKPRGEVTLAEQRGIADFRAKQASSVMNAADREAMLYAAMEKRRAATVKDLPKSVVTDILRRNPAGPPALQVVSESQAAS